VNVRAALLAIMGLAATALAAPMPWQRTEARTPCAAFDPLRAPYFGDLHIHTRFSADAYIFGTRVDPRGAYDFARGRFPLTLADADEAQTRVSHRIDRPLDFAAVTDHAEFYGEVELCSVPGSHVYDQDLCRQLRQPEPDPSVRFSVTVNWLFPVGIPQPPRSHAFCFLPGVDCDAAAVSVWREIQAAAEGAYDRTASCGFTTFIGYEHTTSPLGRHLHRNVIFRNEHVPPFAASHLETWADGVPQGVWSAVETQCLDAGTGCDALIIPHNPNLSGGMQFQDPADAAEAQRRQGLEPLVEIHQQKGNSECRFDRLASLGAGTADELCTFEQQRPAHQGPDEGPPPIERYPLRNMVRNALKDGLVLEQRLGVNPFRLGFVGSSDTHNGTGGGVDEGTWDGGQGNTDATPARRIAEAFRDNPGGLAVAWAEENSRDAVFDALRRRETYATSGTRPVVRFFAGDLRGVTCGRDGFVRSAYATGTPMGGELGAVRGNASPRFAVWAMKDPGTTARPGVDLQRVQIIKGWVDADGRTHEHVFDVAGNAGNGAGVDPATCAPTGTGGAELCTLWQDPTFGRGERAFYYVRVLENPTCRWTTLVCKAAGVDPLAPDCAAQAASAPPDFADCCRGTTNDSAAEPVIQERAWTSPIWYRPEGIARVKGRVDFGPRAATDVLTLHVSFGHSGQVDLARDDLTLRVTDGDELLAVTLPADALGRRKRRLRLPGLTHAAVVVRGDGALRLRLRTTRRDLSAADRADHMVTVSLAAGTYRAAHTRLWLARGTTLATAPRGGAR
jgi:Protein of unknown function (DUF3604)